MTKIICTFGLCFCIFIQIGEHLEKFVKCIKYMDMYKAIFRKNYILYLCIMYMICLGIIYTYITGCKKRKKVNVHVVAGSKILSETSYA